MIAYKLIFLLEEHHVLVAFVFIVGDIICVEREKGERCDVREVSDEHSGCAYFRVLTVKGARSAPKFNTREHS